MMKGCILQTLSCSSGSHQDISQFPSVLQGESFQFSELVITAPLLPGAFSVDKCRRSNSSDLTHAAREDSSGNLSSSSILPQFEKYTINIPNRPGQPGSSRRNLKSFSSFSGGDKDAYMEVRGKAKHPLFKKF